MLGRSKLKLILSKHQQEMQNSRTAHTKTFKSKSDDEKNVSENVYLHNKNKNNSEITENFIGKQEKLVSPVPPIQFFNYIETELKYAKPQNNKKREKDYKNMDLFHRAVCPRQCFALMPVTGVLNPNPKYLRFNFKSVSMIATLIFIASNSVLLFSQTRYLLNMGINAKNMVGSVFFFCTESACVLFLSLAPRWPKIIRYWTKTELIFTRKPYEIPKRNLAKRVQFAAIVIIFLSVVEHGLYLSSAVYSYVRRIQICGALRNETTELKFSQYMTQNYDYVFQLLPYSSFLGVYILVVNAVCTFIWNYMDLFIMMISQGIAYRFEQITMRVNNLADKEVPETIFIEIREHFVKMCELLEYIDDNLSGIILLSCMNNMYFVCYQLLNIFNKLRWPINVLYFWYSLLYLIGRTAFVFLTAASINDQSRGSLSVLRRVSSKTWCIELERLIFQMTTQTIALSGKKFYYLTRRLIFGMAGTIVTYELVLLQFDEPNRSKGLPDLCA